MIGFYLFIILKLVTIVVLFAYIVAGAKYIKVIRLVRSPLRQLVWIILYLFLLVMLVYITSFILGVGFNDSSNLFRTGACS